jgi:hypothetical protein
VWRLIKDLPFGHHLVQEPVTIVLLQAALDLLRRTDMQIEREWPRKCQANANRLINYIPRRHDDH